jgi:hypothetical protein
MPSKNGKVTGRDVLKKAASKIGQEYLMGAAVPFDQDDYDGPWDCAEYVSWVLWKLLGKKYGSTHGPDAEPWTGAWMDDMLADKVHRIPMSLAVKTPGAVLLRRTKKEGHIAFSDGKGGTIEAKGRRWGVCTDSAYNSEGGFRFMYGIVVPEVAY